jgi:hypothetical protein
VASRALSEPSTTTDVWRFNFRVRYGNGWSPPTMAGVPRKIIEVGIF